MEALQILMFVVMAVQMTCAKLETVEKFADPAKVYEIENARINRAARLKWEPTTRYPWDGWDRTTHPPKHPPTVREYRWDRTTHPPKHPPTVREYPWERYTRQPKHRSPTRDIRWDRFPTPYYPWDRSTRQPKHRSPTRDIRWDRFPTPDYPWERYTRQPKHRSTPRVIRWDRFPTPDYPWDRSIRPKHRATPRDSWRNTTPYHWDSTTSRHPKHPTYRGNPYERPNPWEMPRTPTTRRYHSKKPPKAYEN